jgi:fibronectin type 3 domain-containing protein
VCERSADPEVAGYRVYRAEGDGPFSRIADTQELPSFGDHKIESGKAYRYAVTAVKRNGLESDKSAAVAANAP